MSDSARISRALSQPLYLMSARIHREYLLELMVMGNSGTAYKICFQNTHFSCSCPDNETRYVTCKHMYFVLYRVLRLSRDEPIPDPKELEWFLRKFITDEYVGNKSVSTEIQGEDARIPDECPICFEELHGSGPLVYCRAECLQSLHQECYAQACKYGKRECPYCRCKERMVRWQPKAARETEVSLGTENRGQEMKQDHD